MKKEIVAMGIMGFGLVVAIVVCVVAILRVRRHYRNEAFILNDTRKTVTKYDGLGLPVEWSVYMIELAEELNVDCDMCVAILMKENPKFDPEATNRNRNGTFDVGLWQMNDRYLYSDFVKKHWKTDVEFNPCDWKHSTFIAMSHIANLYERFRSFDKTVMAYNCGASAVRNGLVPESTKLYLESVTDNYRLLDNSK